MYIRHLSLSNFRSWPTAELPLQPGVTVLVGRNGAGKTNLVEAAGYLATLSSHRVSGDAALIARGSEQAVVRAAVVSGDRELLLEVELATGRANKARINRSPLRRPRELLGVLRTVVFAPEDLALVRGDPSERRRFLDDLLVQRSPRFAGTRADYDRILKQRNALLKSAGGLRRAAGSRRSGPARDGEPAAEPTTLDVWDEHLAEAGGALVAARLDLLEQLRPHVTNAYVRLAGSGPADVRYRSSVPDPGPADGSASTSALSDEPSPPSDTADPAAPDEPAGTWRSVPTAEQVAAAMRTELLRRRPAELERGISLVGPHRDELELLLGAGPAKGYASHGESWSFALALRLGAFALLRADGVDPVLVLDDVFAELDVSRRERLAILVADAEQVLVTAAVPGDVPAALAGVQVSVVDGTLGPARPSTVGPDDPTAVPAGG